jgi:hypothetical protein
MAGLIKELLLDYALNRLHVDVRSDLTIAIQSALLSFTQREALYLDMYLSGYNAIEIAATEHVEGVLERIFTAIEEQSGYTDDNFIHRLELTKKYRKGGIRELHSFLALHGKSYIAHEMRE